MCLGRSYVFSLFNDVASVLEVLQCILVEVAVPGANEMIDSYLGYFKALCQVYMLPYIIEFWFI
jgi:hypothetical protein